MTKFNYISKNKLIEYSKYIIHVGEREEDKKKVLLKSLKSAYPTHHELNRLKFEYSLLQKLNHNSILEALEMIPSENSLTIVMAYPQGVNLRSLMNKSIDLEDFLRIAKRLTEAVAFLHSHQIIHKNLNPETIYFQEEDGSIQITGFELARELARESFHSSTEEAFEANLAYVSPEQTGRMNRALDQRSDLYSLGVILYELLANQPPFISEDPLGLIHCHIAKLHKPLNQILANIPPIISNIVDKLLAKNTGQRYQSALGVLHDLNRFSELKSLSDDEDFQVGEKDVSNRFNFSDNLFGRTADLEILLQSYEKVKNGESVIALVMGPSGMGKSALVKEVRKSINQNQGFFIQGKFDQFKQNTPLSSLFSAFAQLVRKILTENEQQIEHWKEKVLQAVGTNGRVLTDVIPEIKLLIGDQPPLPELANAEATIRFNLVFNNFVQVFCRKEHPLCIFLDDLQWIDHTTCQWIDNQFSNLHLGHFFLIGAYRDNEIASSHPVMLMIDHLKQKGVPINSIKLSPLSTQSISSLIGETIHLEPEKCQDIVEIIALKTHGNPFFIRQVLLSLYERNAIYFSSEKQSWEYDIQKIKETAISDNVIELMLELLQRLPSEVLDTLKIASCIGSNFDLKTLSEVSDLSIEETTSQLSEAIQLGIILSKGTHTSDLFSNFSFQHDKIQQAAFSLLTKDERQRTQLKIGRLLLSKTITPEESDKLYDITDNLNEAQNLISDESEIAKLVELNLAASRRAQSATAYRPALDYINQAMNLIKAEAWNHPTSLTRDLYIQKAESEHLCGNNDLAAEIFDKAVAHAESDLDKAKVYLRKIYYYNNIGKFEKAYETGRIAASPLGVKLPAKFVPPRLIKDYIQYRLLRGKRSIKDLINVKEMTDEKQKMAVLLMANVTKSAYQIKPELSINLSAKIVNQYLRYGHANGSCVGFVAFGAIFHGAILNQKKSGFEFGQLALDIVEKYKTYQYKSETHFVVGYFAIPWFRPAEEMERLWRISYNAGLEIGDFFHASCSACGTTQSYFMRGLNFDENLTAANRYLDFLNNINYTEGIMTVRGVQQAIRNLQGKTNSRVSFSDDEFDEETYVKGLSSFGSRHFAHYYFINKMRTLYLWGEWEQAYEMVKQSDTYLPDSPGMLHTAEHFFYKGLIVAALYSGAKGTQGSKWKSTLKNIVKRFKKYSENSPSNFTHKYQLLEAEYHRINGDSTQCQSLYYAAIESSKKYGYLHVQALANQLLTQFHQNSSHSRIAGFHLRDAVYDYNALGASAYAEYLLEKYNSISLTTIEKSSSSPLGNVKRSLGDSIVSNIDLKTIFKSSEAISQQVRLKDLLSTMMKIIIENAGAQRIVLFLKEGNQLMVQAECLADNQEVQIFSKVAYSQYDKTPNSVVNFVINTNEPVILDDAYQSGKFGNDAYIAGQQVRSILCAPLSNLGKTIGAIYLENNLSDGVFTQDRIDLIILLSGQMAISIENAMLYENLEEKVKERTEQLKLEKEKSDSLLLNILPSYIAQELKSTGNAKAKHFKQVTVLFADIENFSKICERLGADELVFQLNYFYTAFDKIIMKYNIEKIKTIGDCYMCAGSLDTDEAMSPKPVINAAIEIQQFMNEEIERRVKSNLPPFYLRIGIHTGPVVAGIVGLTKFAYDIWGDTVNIASRMESNGKVGKINISGDTFILIKDDFTCTHRGKIEVKNKGMLDMYFVEN